MPTRDLDLHAALCALANEELERQGFHARIDDIIAYSRSDLPPEELERLRDHFALCTECTELLLDLQAFTRLGRNLDGYEGTAPTTAARPRPKSTPAPGVALAQLLIPAPGTTPKSSEGLLREPTTAPSLFLLAAYLILTLEPEEAVCLTSESLSKDGPQ